MPSDHRLHPASVVFSFASQLKNFVLPGVLVLIGAGRAGANWEPWLMLLLIPNTVVALIHYMSFRYRYDAHEMVIRQGLIFRSERHVPYARIQNLDAVQNIAHRALGVVEVRVQTGSGNEPEAVMSVIPAADFQEMRRRVFEQRPSAESPEIVPVIASPPPLLRLTIRDLMIAGFIENRGMIVIATLFGVLYEFGGIDPLFERVFGEGQSGRGMIRDLFRSLRGADVFDLRRVALGIGALAGVLLFIRTLSMGWAVVRLYGFRLWREGEDLRNEFGLLTRVAATIPVRRIQTLTIYEGPLHRWFRRVAVKVETAGGEGEKRAATERAWLAPIIPPAELPRLLSEVVPELQMSDREWQPLHPRAFGRAFRAALMFWLPVSIVAAVWSSQWILWAPAIPVFAFTWCFVNARKFVRNAAWFVDDEVVVYRRGWIWRRTTVARFAKIQAVELRESPFDRRWAMARVAVDTAGADTSWDRVSIPFLPRDTAQTLYGTLAAAAARTEFRW